MILSSPLIQAISALVIFVIGYLALLISAVACLGMVILSYKGARVLGSYATDIMRRASSASNIALVTHQIARPSR